MKSFPLLLITVLSQSRLISGIVFPGPCPNIKTVTSEFKCSLNITSGSYRAAAYLPVDEKTLNIFFNPFVSINCLDLGITCSYTSTRNIQIRYNCYPTMTGNQTTGIMTQCLPITFDPYWNMYGLNQITTFGLGLQLMCPEKLVDYQIDLIFGLQKEFLGIFGCRNLDNSHDEGAWVVASTSKDLPMNPQELLEQFRAAVTNISAGISDFLINDFSTEHSCSCPKCSYTMECPDDEVEPFYDSDDGMNYPDYSQYDYNYDYPNESYPEYKGDYGTDYVYDDYNYKDASYNEDYYHDYYKNDKDTSRDMIMNEIAKVINKFTTTKFIMDGFSTESFTWETTVNLSINESSFLTEKSFITDGDENKTEILDDDNQSGSSNKTVGD